MRRAQRFLAATSVPAALVASTLFLAPAPASAMCDCASIAAYHAQTRSTIIQNVNQHTTQVGQDIAATIVDIMSRSTKQLSSYLDRQVWAEQRHFDTQIRTEALNDAQKMREQLEIGVRIGMFDPSPMACMTYGANNALFQGRGSAPSANGHDFQNRSRNWARGVDSPGGHTAQDVRDGNIAVAASILEDRDKYEGFDDYLDPTADIRFLTASQTLDTDDEDVAQVTWRLIQNIVDPAPPPPLTSAQINTPEGKVEAARRQVDDARKSVAQNVFTFRTNFQGNYSEELRKWISDNAPEGFQASDNPKASLKEFFEARVHLFNHPDFLLKLNEADTNGLLRELIQLEAFRLNMDWLRFQLDLDRSLVGATLLASHVNSGERNISY